MAREVSTDLTMLERLVDLGRHDVLDIGCGDGALARALAARGARMIALEVSEEQLAAALAGDGGSGVRYIVGRAESLPLDEDSVDVTVFMRTLHHVPSADLPEALREAGRVTRPGGFVYVAEPLPEGDFFALTSLVEDEREVRQAAQAVIAGARRAGLERVTTVEYDVRLRLEGLHAFHSRTVRVDPARDEVFEAHRNELAEVFERLGEPGERPGERCFLSPTRVDLLRPAGRG